MPGQHGRTVGKLSVPAPGKSIAKAGSMRTAVPLSTGQHNVSVSGGCRRRAGGEGTSLEHLDGAVAIYLETHGKHRHYRCLRRSAGSPPFKFRPCCFLAA